MFLDKQNLQQKNCIQDDTSKTTDLESQHL